MKFYIVDAFTETLFGGNPAGVVLIPQGEEYPSESIMKKTAAELRYSETVFIKRNSDGEFHLRYFTPTDEVDLCGHATIGSFSALLQRNIITEGRNCLCETAAGRINVNIEKNIVMMDMATPTERGKIEELPALAELYKIMGLEPSDGEITALSAIECEEKQKKLFPEIISTGLPDILLPVADRDALARISPDYPALAALSERYGVTGVHAFALGSVQEVTAYCRNFAPAYGIPEEAATGTSSGALTYYLYKNGLIKGGDTCVYIQGEAMGRPSKIVGELNVVGDAVKVRIGGTGVILAEGEIFLPLSTRCAGPF